MRRTEPWGLAEHWLLPGKVITDPIHGDIYLSVLEMAIVDSAAFQRLRRVRQLGTVELVYPGATHTRFAHSLGTLKIAQDLVDIVVDQRSGRDEQPDLFGQWVGEFGVLVEDGRYDLSEGGLQRFDREIAKITVLARLGALMHDFCHVPFGHSIEDDLEILDSHDKNGERFDRLFGTVEEPVRRAMEAQDLMPNLRRLILSGADDLLDAEYPFVDDVVGNTICADLLDYLRRDHVNSGLPIALGRRFESGFYVLPDGDPLYQRRMVLRIHRDREERTDVITEILKHLRYRYELSERALVHHTKLAADAMIGKALEFWRDALWAESASDAIEGAGNGSPDQPVIVRDLDDLSQRLEDSGGSQQALDAAVKNELDAEMTRRGDDGLLEYMRDLPTARPRDGSHHRDAARRRASAELARRLHERVLFKRIAIQHHARRDREKLWEEHHSAKARREIERAASRFAGIEPEWSVLVWLPSPKMRLKVAGVLVDDGKEIIEFFNREAEGKHRGQDIYEAHKNLWGVSVFVEPSVAKDVHLRDAVLASVAADLDMQFGNLAGRLGPKTYEWPDRLALERLARSVDEVFTQQESEELLERRWRDRAARGGEARPPIEVLMAEYRALRD